MLSHHQFLSFGEESCPLRDKPWLWHGILMPGKLTLFTSLWKSGKTTLLAHLLAQRRQGGEFLGLNVRPGCSVVVSEEPRDLWPMRQRQYGFGPELGILNRWLDRAVEPGLAMRQGRGTKNEPYRYGLALST